MDLKDHLLTQRRSYDGNENLNRQDTTAGINTTLTNRKNFASIINFNINSNTVQNLQAQSTKINDVQSQAERRGFLSFWHKGKKTIDREEPEVVNQNPVSVDTDYEDVFTGSQKPRKHMTMMPNKKDKMINSKQRKAQAREQIMQNEEFVKIKLWIRKDRSEQFRPAKFCECLVDFYAAADQRNIFSAPTIQRDSANATKIQTTSAVQSPSDKSETKSFRSSSDYHSSGSTLDTGSYFDPLISSTTKLPSRSSRLSNVEATSVVVECILQDNRVLMQPAPLGHSVDRTHSKIRKPRRRPGSAVSYISVMEHPSFCCAHRMSSKEYDKLPDPTKQRGVDVGVSILLESGDEKILITRRAFHMRTFPGVWVPPGGHIEDGEAVLDAGIREVFEETGLVLKKGPQLDRIRLILPSNDDDVDDEIIDSDPSVNRYNLLGLWESCYPPVLYVGQTMRQHLVYYLHIQVSQGSAQIQPHLKLQRTEVGACAWLSRNHAEVVAFSSKPLPDKPIPITLLDENSESLSEGFMDPKVLRKKMPEPMREIERLTTGTRYALKLWLTLKNEEDVEAEFSAL